MATVNAGRMTAVLDGDFVVFLIGLRLNRPWKVHKWLPVFTAMPRMLRELYAQPESGFLGHAGAVGVMVQYWRSFEQLEAYARDPSHVHWPAWVAFNRKVRASSGDVGIWHETYRVAAGQYESVYSSMPVFGLGKAGRLVPAEGRRSTARGRIAGPADAAEAVPASPEYETTP